MPTATLIRLSSKGQVVIPKSIRHQHQWHSGQQFMVEETNNGILLRPVKPALFSKTTLQQAAGCLQSAYAGKPKTQEDMEDAICQGVEAYYGRR